MTEQECRKLAEEHFAKYKDKVVLVNYLVTMENEGEVELLPIKPIRVRIVEMSDWARWDEDWHGNSKNEGDSIGVLDTDYYIEPVDSLADQKFFGRNNLADLELNGFWIDGPSIYGDGSVVWEVELAPQGDAQFATEWSS